MTTHRSIVRTMIAAAGIALLASACGDTDSTSAPGTTTAASTTATSADPTATTPRTSTPETTATTATVTTSEPTATTATVANSGCTPGSDELPDGRWFGQVVDATTEHLDFDLACWLTGDEAAAAAREDGEESPPPNDYYVRNESDRVRRLAVASGLIVRWLADPGGPELTDAEYRSWVQQRSTRPFQPGVWLTVRDGAVVAAQEQYTP